MSAAQDAQPLQHANSGTQQYSSSEGSNGSPHDKDRQEELETIHTNERVGSHTNYYEKDGLRTEGDGEDHVGAHHKVRCFGRRLSCHHQLTLL